MRLVVVTDFDDADLPIDSHRAEIVVVNQCFYTRNRTTAQEIHQLQPVERTAIVETHAK